MKKENWYFLIALIGGMLAMCYSVEVAWKAPRFAYAIGFLMGMIVMKFFVFVAMDSKQPAQSDSAELCCEAVQYSDLMTCRCGNCWDVNDTHPPTCNGAALKASLGIGAHTAEIAQTVANIRGG